MLNKNITVLVCGQPNTGKTSVINKLSGSSLKVANFPGVTVEKAEVSFGYKGKIITLIDLPGSYSDQSSSEDQELSIKTINSQEYDNIIYVCSALNIDRGIFFLNKVLKLTSKPVFLYINMSEMAKQNGIFIDGKRIKNTLGDIPFSLIDIKSKKDDAKSNILDQIIESSKPRETKEINAEEVLSKGVTFKKLNSKNISNIIDRVILNKYLAMPIFMATMFVVFAISFLVGDVPSEFIESKGGDFCSFVMSYIGKNIITSAFFNGICPGLLTVIAFVPRIFLMFTCISLLEKTGYMARVVLVTDNLLNKFGLSGKSSISILSGFGCSIPAYMSTRILDNHVQKVATMFAISVLPCSAKMTLLMLFVSAFFSAKAAPFVIFGLYFFGLMIGLLVALVVSKNIGNDSKRYINIIELPLYKLPTFQLVSQDVMQKVKSFLLGAGFSIATMSFAVWLSCNLPFNPLNIEYWKKVTSVNHSIEDKDYILSHSIAGEIGMAISPIFKPLGFDWKMSLSVISAIGAKEVAIGSLSVLYHIDEDQNDLLLSERLRNEISFSSAIAYMIFVLICTPCTSAIVSFFNETKSKKYLLWLILSTIGLAYIFATLAKVFFGLIAK